MKLVSIDKEFEIFGISIVTKNSNKDVVDKISTLWAKFASQIYDRHSKIYGLYHNYESDFTGSYKLTIGTKSQSSNLEKATIFAGSYAVFTTENEPLKIQALWAQIWEYFKNPELKRAYLSDFELYAQDRVEIYIGIK